MKKILIIANLTYASPRIPGICQYLHNFKWNVTILTPRMNDKQKALYLPKDVKNLNIIVTEDYISTSRDFFFRYNPKNIVYEIIRKIYHKTLFSFYQQTLYKLIRYPDLERKWIKHALKKIDQIMVNTQFDAILTSSSPVTCHIIAKKIKEKYNIPWVADLRDLWTQNHTYPYSSFRKIFEKKLEMKTLMVADALITVSPPWAKKLRSVYNNMDVYTLTNGFNPDNKACESNIKNDKFIFLYTGQIYEKKQNPKIIVTAIRNLIEKKMIDKNKISFMYYGHSEKLVSNDIWIKKHSTITRNEILKLHYRASMLVLFNWEDKDEKGTMPLKFYEYMRTGIPIIATGGYGEDFQEKILEKTQTGLYCKTIETAEKYILYHYKFFIKNGYTKNKCVKKEVQKYSYPYLAKKLSIILNKI